MNSDLIDEPLDSEAYLELNIYFKDKPLDEGLLLICSRSFYEDGVEFDDQNLETVVDNHSNDPVLEYDLEEEMENLTVADQFVEKELDPEFVDAWYEHWKSQGEQKVLEIWEKKYSLSTTQGHIDIASTDKIKNKPHNIESTLEELWVDHQKIMYENEYIEFSQAWNEMSKKSKKGPKKKRLAKYRNPKSILTIKKEAESLGFKFSTTPDDVESFSAVSLQNPNSRVADTSLSAVNLTDMYEDVVQGETANDCEIFDGKDNSCYSLSNSTTMKKYWGQRYRLFSKFDLGVQLDLESWFSVTAEKIALHHAKRLKCGVIIDAFCGAGGNAIQFAKTCEKVIAIDIDPLKIKLARHNAAIYNVQKKIEFIVGDFTHLYSQLIGDVVFLSPPWGGPDYIKTDVYDVNKMLILKGKDILDLARHVTHNIAIYMPRNSDLSQMMLLCPNDHSIEVEQNFLSRRLKSLTAYFGDLIRYDNS